MVAVIFDTALNGSSGYLAAVPFMVIAVGVALVEKSKRASTDTDSQVWAVDALISTVLNFTGELVALVVCGVIVTALLARHQSLNPITPGDAAWKEITNEWPILMTGDTLLAMQAMLRLILLGSATFRKSYVTSPIACEASAFWLLAALARVIVLLCSPADVYRIDGPLGGKWNIACEVAAVPLLLYMCGGMIKSWRRTGCILTTGIFLAVFASTRNQLALANPRESYLDATFTLVHMLELGAAVAVLIRTATAWAGAQLCRDSSTKFSHVLLPVQQSLSAYFFLFAFSPPFEFPPEIVRVGHPLQLLRLAGLAQVGVYLLAGVLHFTGDHEEQTGSHCAVEV